MAGEEADRAAGGDGEEERDLRREDAADEHRAGGERNQVIKRFRRELRIARMREAVRPDLLARLSPLNRLDHVRRVPSRKAVGRNIAPGAQQVPHHGPGSRDLIFAEKGEKPADDCALESKTILQVFWGEAIPHAPRQFQVDGDAQNALSRARVRHRA